MIYLPPTAQSNGRINNIHFLALTATRFKRCFSGGIQVYDADPGIGVWLVPLGAFFLLAGVLVTAMGTTNSQD